MTLGGLATQGRGGYGPRGGGKGKKRGLGQRRGGVELVFSKFLLVEIRGRKDLVVRPKEKERGKEKSSKGLGGLAAFRMGGKGWWVGKIEGGLNYMFFRTSGGIRGREDFCFLKKRGIKKGEKKKRRKDGGYGPRGVLRCKDGGEKLVGMGDRKRGSEEGV